jgi:hypothetical protein
MSLAENDAPPFDCPRLLKSRADCEDEGGPMYTAVCAQYCPFGSKKLKRFTEETPSYIRGGQSSLKPKMIPVNL